MNRHGQCSVPHTGCESGFSQSKVQALNTHPLSYWETNCCSFQASTKSDSLHISCKYAHVLPNKVMFNTVLGNLTSIISIIIVITFFRILSVVVNATKESFT